MKNKKKHSKKNKIRGDLSCFKGTELEKMANCLHSAPLIEDDLIKLRNIGKDAFGLRMQLAAKLSNVYKPISPKSLDIILDYMKTWDNSHNVEGFADCFFDSYNGNNYTKIKNPKCMTNVTRSAFKHGVKDCTKAIKTYFTPIYLRMKKTGMLEICENNIVGRYKDIDVALSFVVNFLYTLHCEDMPNRLSNNVFDNAKKIDDKISMYYEYDKENAKYTLNKNKNNKYSVISQECAAYLICYKHK